MPGVLARMEQEPRRPAVFLCLRFCLLTARSPTECRLATWSQFDLERGIWRFPAMQNVAGLVVEIELREELLNIIARARGLATGHLQDFVFPSRVGSRDAFSERSLNGAMIEAGYGVSPRDFLHAHKAWTTLEGGDRQDLRAWLMRLRGQAPA
jgi:integrase